MSYQRQLEEHDSFIEDKQYRQQRQSGQKKSSGKKGKSRNIKTVEDAGDEAQKKFREVLIRCAKEYLEIDDKLSELKDKKKVLDKKKKENEQKLLNLIGASRELQKDGISLNSSGIKLQKTVKESRGAIKEKMIYDVLKVVMRSDKKATDLTNEIMNKRPVKQTTKLTKKKIGKTTCN